MSLFTALVASAQQQPEKPDVYEQAELEADRLQRVLDLEDWQLYGAPVFLIPEGLEHCNDFYANKQRNGYS